LVPLWLFFPVYPENAYFNTKKPSYLNLFEDGHDIFSV